MKNNGIPPFKPKEPEKPKLLAEDELFLSDKENYSLEEIISALPSHVKITDIFFSPFTVNDYYYYEGWRIWWKEASDSLKNRALQEKYKQEMEEYNKAMIQYRIDLKAFNEPKIKEELRKAEKRVEDLKKSLEGGQNETNEETD